MSAPAIRALGFAAALLALAPALAPAQAPVSDPALPVGVSAEPASAPNPEQAPGQQAEPQPSVSALVEAPPRVSFEIEGPGGLPLTKTASALEYGTWLLRNRGVVSLPQYADVVRWELEAEALGVTPDRSEIEPRVQALIDTRLEGAFGGDPEPWIAELRRAGRSEPGFRMDTGWTTWSWLLGDAVTRVGRVVPEEKLRREWELLYGPEGKRIQFAGLQREVIVDQSVPGMTRQEFIERGNEMAAEAAEELEGLRRQLEDGADFQALVLEHSDDTASRGRGGRFLEHFSAVGWGGQALEAMLQLPVGGVSEPLRCRGGVWLLKVISIQETPFESVREELEELLVERGPEDDEIALRLEELQAKYPLEVVADLSDWTEELLRANPVVARIAQREIRADEIELWLRQTQGEPLLSRFRDRKVVEQRAANAGIEISQEEIEERLDRERETQINVGHLGSVTEWVEGLAARGRTEAQWRKEVGERVRMELQIEELLMQDRVIDEVAVKSEWYTRYGEHGKRIEARYIRRKIAVEPREEGEGDRAFLRRVMTAGEEDYRLLEGLVQRVQDGEDFGALAQRYSDDEESARLGGRAPGGFVFEEWDDMVRTDLLLTPVGGLTEPLLVDATLYLFEVIGVEEVPFESVSAALRKELEEARPAGVERALYLNVLSRAHPYERLPDFFE